MILKTDLSMSNANPLASMIFPYSTILLVILTPGDDLDRDDKFRKELIWYPRHITK